MLRKIVPLIGLLVIAAAPSMAADIHFEDPISTKAFRTLSREAGAAIAFRNAAPTQNLGITGFDAGLEITAVDINKEAEQWESAFGDDAPSFLTFPSLRARKGLPFGIDVGAKYSWVPDTNINVIGVEVSKALLEGGAVTPAIGIRGTYTRLLGVSDLDLQTAGIDASISKGLPLITPYAGAGMLWIDSKLSQAAQDRIGSDIERQKLWQPRVFAGVQLTPLPLFRLLGEVEYSERAIYTLKAAVGF